MSRKRNFASAQGIDLKEADDANLTNHPIPKASAYVNDGYHNADTTSAFNYFCSVDQLPFSTPISQYPGIGGVIKQFPSHFRVIEIDDLSMHAPDGILDMHGACHIFMTITREGLNTADVQQMIAGLIGCTDSRDIGVCGLKDKWARCTQTFSVPSYSTLEKRHLSPAELTNLVSSRFPTQLKVERTAINSTKLRRNMHKGNRFEIVVSEIPLTHSEALKRAKDVLVALESAGGIPNYYGAQRFSVGCQSALRGGRLLLNMQQSKSGSKKKRLRSSIVRSAQRRFFLSAFSSMLFNVWLARRIEKGNFNQLLDGDLVVASDDYAHESEEQAAHVSREAGESIADGSALQRGPVEDMSSGAHSQKVRSKTKKYKKGSGSQRFSFFRYKSSSSSNSCAAAINDANTGHDAHQSARKFKLGKCSYTGPMFGARCPMPYEESEAYKYEKDIEDLSGVRETTYRTLEVFGTRREGRLVLKNLNMKIREWDSKEAEIGGKDNKSETQCDLKQSKSVEEKSSCSLIFEFSLPAGSYATAVLREFMKVPLRMEKSEELKRSDLEVSSKKHKPSLTHSKFHVPHSPPVPMSADELVEFCRERKISFRGPRKSLGSGYKVFFLRSKRKPRRYALVLFQSDSQRTPENPRRSIEEWSRLLGFRHTARLSDSSGIQSTLGCSATGLSPLSVCNKIKQGNGVTSSPHATVTVAIEQALVDSEDKDSESICWMKAEDNADDAHTSCLRIGFRISSYIKLLRACGLKPVVM